MSLLWISALALITSLNFSKMKHPLAMGLTLLIQTIFICGNTSLSSKTSWFAFILFLIFLGAMLVLFVYVASLASNEPFNFSPPMLILSLTLATLLFAFLFLDPLLIFNKEVTSPSNFSHYSLLDPTQMIIKSIYSPCWASLTSFIILYLLLTLIVIVKITSTFFGPLRLT